MKKKSVMVKVDSKMLVATSSSTSEILLLERARNILRGGNKRKDDLEDSASSRYPSEIIDKIMENLKVHLPISGQEGLQQQLMNIAVSSEKQIYAAAKDESDYSTMISLKMMSMVQDFNKFLNPMADSVLFNAVDTSAEQHGGDKLQFMQLSVSQELIKPSEIGNKDDQLDGTSLSLSLFNKNESDWRTQLEVEPRNIIVNNIIETLKRHLPYSGHEGLVETKKIAVRFEEKIYTVATSQSDYLRKISLKMLTLETKLQPESRPSSPKGGSRSKRKRFKELSEEEMMRPFKIEKDEPNETGSPVLYNFL